MTVTDTKPVAPRTYGNWRKPVTPGLPGLGLLGTVVALGGVVLAVLIEMIAGLGPAVVAVVLLAIVLAPLLYKNRSGRNGWQAATARTMWLLGRRRKQNLFRSGVVAGPVATGQHTLPGLLARSTLYDAVDSHGNHFAMLHVPATRHYSVVLKCDPEGSMLVDQETVDLWVALWGRWIAELGREPNLEAASATIETAADPGSRLALEIEHLRGAEASSLANAMLDEVAASYAKGSPSVSGRVALTYSATRRFVDDRELFTGKRRGEPKRARVMTPEEMATQIGSRLPGLIRELTSTGAGGGVRAMTVAEVAELVRVAYDPAAGPSVEAARAEGRSTGITWDNAGPAAQAEQWASLTHDSGTSVTWQMTDAPRGVVQSQVLRALLEPNDKLARKRVTLLYRPHDPAAAARIADSDVRTAIGRASARAGEGRAADTLDLAAARQTASEEASGAGLTRFGLLATATVTEGADLPHVADLMDQAGGASRLALRRVYAAQSAAFAASLGVGVVLHNHVAVPSAIRQYL